MKILVVNYEYPPIGGGGGSSCQEIVERLVKRGHTVDVFTAGYKKFQKIEKQKNGLTIYRVKSNRKSEHEVGFFGLVSFLLRGMFKIRKFAFPENYDVIHYHFSVPTGLLSFFHTKKIPAVITLHGIDVPGFHKDEFPLFQKLTKFFNKRIIKRADKVIAVSNNLKEKAEETFKNKKISVIYHGVDLNKFYVKSDKINSDEIRFITVARLVKFKRIDLLIKAFKNLTEKSTVKMSLKIIGTGYQENELKELVAQMNLEKLVTFTGSVPNEDLVHLLNDADVFVLPTVHDSFGIVFLEAMACGLPCIGTRSAGVPEVIAENNTGYLARPNDLNSLVVCMEKLVNDKKTREEFSKAAVNLVRKKFSWEKIVNEYEKIFLEVTGE